MTTVIGRPHPFKLLHDSLSRGRKHAEEANERLRKEFPKGFALGTTHKPHISCLQRYVKAADLDKVYEAVGKVLAEEKPTTWKLKA